MEKKSLNPEESLDLIQSMIRQARNKTTENGFHFIWWGVLVITASLTQYILIMNDWGDNSNIVWLIMPVIGVPVGIIHEYLKHKNGIRKTETHIDKAYGRLWFAFGLTLGLVIFLSVFQKINPMPFILSLVGLATFVSGSLFGVNSLIAGSIVFWVSAIISIWINGPEILLLNAAATFLGYILPGLQLNKIAKSSKQDV